MMRKSMQLLRTSVRSCVRARKPFVALGLFICLVVSCDRGVEPEKPGARNYTWTVTELPHGNLNQHLMRSVWGRNANDLYVCGVSTLYADDGGLLHKDASGWSFVSVPVATEMQFSSVRGTGTDIWIIGYKSYDGGQDSAVVLRKTGDAWTSSLPDHMGTGQLLSVNGDSPPYVFVGSENGRILTFDGMNWVSDSIRTGFLITSFAGDANSMLLLMRSNSVGGGPNIVDWYRRSQESWEYGGNVLVGGADAGFPSPKLWTDGQGTYFATVKGTIYSVLSDSFSVALETEVSFRAIGGSGPSNVFAVGRFDAGGSVVYHWNGHNWISLGRALENVSSTVTLYDIWCMDNEVFVVGNDGGRSYVLHGN